MAYWIVLSPVTLIDLEDHFSNYSENKCSLCFRPVSDEFKPITLGMTWSKVVSDTADGFSLSYVKWTAYIVWSRLQRSDVIICKQLFLLSYSTGITVRPYAYDDECDLLAIAKFLVLTESTRSRDSRQRVVFGLAYFCVCNLQYNTIQFIE